MHEAMKSGDFSPDSRGWDNVALSMVYESPHAGFSGKQASKHDFLKAQERLHTENPEYEYHVMSINTEVEPDKETASVFMNVETKGAPLGITRRYMTVLEFKKRGSKWFMVKASSLQATDWEDYAQTT